MPCNQDLYFSSKDNEFEAKYMPNAKLHAFDSDWGHCAANPGNDPDFEAKLENNIRELLK